jgi:hypothetical protein
MTDGQWSMVNGRWSTAADFGFDQVFGLDLDLKLLLFLEQEASLRSLDP